MKPVVSALNAWTCTVISCFAIVILSIIGSLFARDHHMMMGMEEDPEDHTAVASAVFISVAVYACSAVSKRGFTYERVDEGRYPYSDR